MKGLGSNAASSVDSEQCWWSLCCWMRLMDLKADWMRDDLGTTSVCAMQPVFVLLADWFGELNKWTAFVDSEWCWYSLCCWLINLKADETISRQQVFVACSLCWWLVDLKAEWEMDLERATSVGFEWCWWCWCSLRCWLADWFVSWMRGDLETATSVDSDADPDGWSGWIDWHFN